MLRSHHLLGLVEGLLVVVGKRASIRAIIVIVMVLLVLLLLHDGLVVQSSFVQLGHVKFVQIFFLLQVLVEACKLGPDLEDVIHLLHQNSIELVDILFNLTVRLLYFLEYAHVLLDNVHDIINVLSMIRYQRLLFLKNHLDQKFMVLTDPLNIVPVVLLNVLVIQ